MTNNWYQVEAPHHKETPLIISAKREGGKYGRYALYARSGCGDLVWSEHYPWNVWAGHCNGYLLVDDFISKAEKMANRSCSCSDIEVAHGHHFGCATWG